MLKFKAKIFIFVSLLLAANPLFAGRTASLYDVEALVVDESANVRWAAFKQGLEEVFIRISGDSIVMDKLKRPAPTQYVKQYSYDPVPEPIINAQGKQLRQRIKIQYNGRLMEKYLRDNGFPVWGEHRSDVVVWLTVRDGKNEYVLKDTDQSQLKTAMDEALNRRGVPERWPLYDYKDRKILSVADIRGGFKGPLINASKRYSSGPALAGSMSWNGRQWQSSWSLLMASGEQYWSLVDSDYERLIDKAVDQAADAMGNVFAIHGAANKQQLATIQLDIQAVNSIEKYRRVENYLSGLSAVAQAKPLKVDGQNAVFTVTLRSNEKDFLNLIHNDAELIEAQAIKPQQPTPPLVPENEAATDEQMKKAESGKLTDNTSEHAEANSFSLAEQQQQQQQQQQPQVPVYHYRLNK